MSAQDRQQRRRKQKAEAQERIKALEAEREREAVAVEADEEAERNLERGNTGKPEAPPAPRPSTPDAELVLDSGLDLADPAAIDFSGFNQEN